MFTDFTKKSFNQIQKLKNKDVKQVHYQLLEHYPQYADIFKPLETGYVSYLKTANRTVFVAVDGVLQYLSFYNSPYCPMLRTLQRLPGMGRYIVVDGGAVRAMLNGAQLMAPGIAEVDERLKINDLAALKVEGGEAFAIGKMVQTRQDLLKQGRSGIAVETITIIGDGLWDAGDKL